MVDQGFDRTRHAAPVCLDLETRGRTFPRPARLRGPKSREARYACYNARAHGCTPFVRRWGRRTLQKRMKKGFYTIMSAQFFSSLADNALLVGAIELLKSTQAPAVAGAGVDADVRAVLRAAGALVGAFADAVPKGRVMFVSNTIKVVGCLLMLFGGHPLLAYAVVGLGAAAYSPAKYGILTELLPPSQLVKANGWIEGLTIASIILGVLLGGQLVGPRVAPMLLGFDLPMLRHRHRHRRPRRRSRRSCCCTSSRRSSTCYIPRTDAPLQPLRISVVELVQRLHQCNARLWADKLGQISLATTTLFWGVSGNLRVIVFAWAAAALGYGTTQASSLVGVVAIGTALGRGGGVVWRCGWTAPRA